MTRSTWWNKEERPQKKTSRIVQPGLTYGSQHLEVDLEPSAKRGANRTKALVSLYWLSRSLHLKELPNQISHKSTKVDPIRSSRTWKKSDLIFESYALQHIITGRMWLCVMPVMWSILCWTNLSFMLLLDIHKYMIQF